MRIRKHFRSCALPLPPPLPPPNTSSQPGTPPSFRPGTHPSTSPYLISHPLPRHICQSHCPLPTMHAEPSHASTVTLELSAAMEEAVPAVRNISSDNTSRKSSLATFAHDSDTGTAFFNNFNITDTGNLSRVAGSQKAVPPSNQSDVDIKFHGMPTESSHTNPWESVPKRKWMLSWISEAKENLLLLHNLAEESIKGKGSEKERNAPANGCKVHKKELEENTATTNDEVQKFGVSQMSGPVTDSVSRPFDLVEKLRNETNRSHTIYKRRQSKRIRDNNNTESWGSHPLDATCNEVLSSVLYRLVEQEDMHGLNARQAVRKAVAEGYTALFEGGGLPRVLQAARLMRSHPSLRELDNGIFISASTNVMEHHKEDSQGRTEGRDAGRGESGSDQDQLNVSCKMCGRVKETKKRKIVKRTKLGKVVDEKGGREMGSVMQTRETGKQEVQQQLENEDIGECVLNIDERKGNKIGSRRTKFCHYDS